MIKFVEIKFNPRSIRIGVAWETIECVGRKSLVIVFYLPFIHLSIIRK